MPADTQSDAKWAFDAYEAVRARLPHTTYPDAAKPVANLADIADEMDVFLLDAFGVLNIGETAISGAPERISDLQKAGKRVIVLSNAASIPKPVLLAKYARLGFDFTPENVLTSREVLLDALADKTLGHIGMMGLEAYGNEELEHLDFDFLGDDPATYEACDSFILMGAGQWNDARQTMLERALIAQPRPVFVGNPDIVAPREDGLSKEPGLFAHRLADATGVVPEFYGKPFAKGFDMALAKVGGIDPARIVMVGDTLHTDILGGQAAGIATALITAHGALKGIDANAAIQASGIVPHYIMPTT